MNRNERRAAKSGKGNLSDAAVTLVTQAVPLHQAGRLAEAEALYRQALRAAPRQPDALHLLGMLACQTGRFAEAAELIGKAVAVNGQVPDFHANLAFALQALDRPREAESAARTALRLRRPFPEAANTLGNALNAQGRFADAAAAYREAVNARPDYREAQGNLGAVLRTLGRSAEAEPVLRAALAGNPHLTEARVALGLALLDLGRLPEGEEVLRGAIAQRPDHGGALLALAGLRQRGGADSGPAYRRFMTVEPADAEAWNGHGLLLQSRDRLAEAEAAFRRAIRLAPGMTEASTNLGNIRRLRGDAAGAEALHRAVLAVRPDYAAAHANLGLALQDRGDEAAAEACFSCALDHDPGEAVARFNRAILRLRQGRLAEGWGDYADRFSSPVLGRARRIGLPEWRGEALAGRRILVWEEQGLGDLLMFGTVLPDLADRAGSVIVECDRRLVGLLARALPGAMVRPPSRDPRDADLHCPVGALPRYLRPGLSGFSGRAGWLAADPALGAAWRSRLEALGTGLKIGIAWTSRHVTTERSASYTRLEQWAPLLTLPGVVAVPLQYDLADPGRAAEVAAVEARLGIRLARWDDLDLTGDLENAAALTAGLDLVVSVASSSGELAASLGVPVWRLGGGDWTQLGTAVRPWFPCQRVIRPPAGGTVADAVARAAGELAALGRRAA